MVQVPEEPMVELTAVAKEGELVVAVDMLEEQAAEGMAVGKGLAAAVVMLVEVGLLREVADMVAELAPAVVMLGKGVLREVVDMAMVEVPEEVMPVVVSMQVDMAEAPATVQVEVTVAIPRRSIGGISMNYKKNKHSYVVLCLVQNCTYDDLLVMLGSLCPMFK